MKILFIVLGTESAGELTIAMEFARRLPQDRCDIRFLIPGKFSFFFQTESFHLYVLEPKQGKLKNSSDILEIFNIWKPEMTILSDPYTMEYASSWSGVRFEQLREFGCRVVGVDEYEYESTGYRIDYYGGQVKRLPPFVGQCDAAIRNCPLNTPRQTSPGIKNYSFLGEKKKLGKNKRKQVRDSLGIGENEKMIFFSTSKWENMNPSKIMSLSAFQKWRPVILAQYLNRLEGKIALVHVGQEPMVVDTGKISYVKLQDVSPPDYENYLLSSDLFITFNIVSVTLSKAVFGEVPAIVLQNEKVINYARLTDRLKQMPAWYQSMAAEVAKIYPFKASTFGWHEFLRPVLKDNDYVNTFLSSPFLKMNTVLENMETLLFDQSAIRSMREKQRMYMERILALPSPHRVVGEIMDEIRL